MVEAIAEDEQHWRTFWQRSRVVATTVLKSRVDRIQKRRPINSGVVYERSDDFMRFLSLIMTRRPLQRSFWSMPTSSFQRTKHRLEGRNKLSAAN